MLAPFHQHAHHNLGIPSRSVAYEPGIVLILAQAFPRRFLSVLLITCALPDLPQNSMPCNLIAPPVPPSFITHTFPV